MHYIAVQTIASGFGTYHVGEHIDPEVPPTVVEAWEAAGLIESSSAAPDEPKKAAPVEKATRAPKQTTAHKRMQTKPTPHKRFVEKVP